MSTNELVPVFTGTLAGQSQQLCNARDLHAFLKVGRDFSNWIKDRIENGRFVEGDDYSPNLANRSGGGAGKRRIDYHLSLDMAKHLALLENNEVGDQVRRYFIACEKQARAVAGGQKALPAPRLAVSKDLRAAINRRAHEIAVRQYDVIHSILTDVVEDNLSCGADEAACFGLVDLYGSKADGTVVLNIRDVEDMIFAVGRVVDEAGTAIGMIRRIEARAGRELYCRLPRNKYVNPEFRKHDRLINEVIDRISGGPLRAS